MKMEWHHWLWMLLIVFIGISLARVNFLGVPRIVDGLVTPLAGSVGNVIPTTTA